ncbi:hypothetical protein BWQ96_05875 [Gracilariopsis chorda]|uniref:Uncharacterized protein n=1 Tax=Gracilariopsis chorda TaxID=448386 RepID=A0A2V3IQH2_9FLOR|nr:hypothetical protein BWQ96_05875 [Gracilariopsis chorda]|eukprot:PXF44355.1 hypothetical protein BWQ96_05875 [Gracilariopsis chorda]
MRSFPAAANMVDLTSLVATAFGYADAIKAAWSVRARIEDMGTELREQYDMIIKNISQGDEIETDNDVEEWDAQLEKKLNITIQRCNDESPNGDAPFVSQNDSSPLTKEASATPLPVHLSNGNISFQDRAEVEASDPMRRSSQSHISRWATGPQQGNLVEAELRNYLGRVAVAASALSAPQMYPKPTQPFN